MGGTALLSIHSSLFDSRRLGEIGSAGPSLLCRSFLVLAPFSKLRDTLVLGLRHGRRIVPVARHHPGRHPPGRSSEHRQWMHGEWEWTRHRDV